MSNNTYKTIEDYIVSYLSNNGVVERSSDTEWRYAVKSISKKYNLSKFTNYLLSDNLTNQRLVRIAQELIDLGEDVGNFKIRPSEIIYDISGRSSQTFEAAKAWNILSGLLTLHRQKYGTVNPDYKAEALLTGIYHDCVFLVSESFCEPDLIEVSKRLRFQGHSVVIFKQVD